MTQPISEDTWLERCAAQFQRRAGLTNDEAMEFAKACIDWRDDELYSPEDVADEDMSNWDQDE